MDYTRKIIHECTLCKKYEGKSYCYPEAPDLPESRLRQFCAFHNIGIDYAGPVYVHKVYNENNNLFKSWIALITCQSSRAIYLDLAKDYSGPSCINVLKSFFSRRGIPDLITSYNGSNFTSIGVQTFTTNNGITWKFNLEAAPWTGGFFERLMQSVKRCLKKILGKSKVSYEDLVTILVEIEIIINNRPLTYVSGDLTEEALTSSHLIYGKRLRQNKCTDLTILQTQIHMYKKQYSTFGKDGQKNISPNLEINKRKET